jgi:exonuclease-1
LGLATVNDNSLRKRAQSKIAGLDLLKLGRTSQAHLELQKAIDVTPIMARHIIDACTALGVKCLVAPYEADSQLYYLEKKGIIDAVVSEDSDLLVFGVRTLITKLDQFGECVEVNRDHFTACKDISLAGWTPKQFRHMCILSGCDYLENIPSMGLKTAHRLLRRYNDVEKVLRALKFDGKMKVPEGYFEAFKRADMTFMHQRVFCPIENRLVMANDPDPDTVIDDEILVYIGPDIDVEIARLVASGHLDPMTKQPILIPKATLKANPFAKQWTPSSQPKKVNTPHNGKTITQFFKPKSEVRPTSSTPLRIKDINTAMNSMSAPAKTFAAPISTSAKRPLPPSFTPESKKAKLQPSDTKSSPDDTPATAERSSFFKAQSRRPLGTPTPKPRVSLLEKENISPSVTASANLVIKKETTIEKSPLPSSRVQKSAAQQKPAMAPPTRSLTNPEHGAEDVAAQAAKKVAQGWKELYGFSAGGGGKKLSEIIEKQRQSSTAPQRMTPLQRMGARSLSSPMIPIKRTAPLTNTPSLSLVSSQSSGEDSQDSDGYFLSAGNSAASSQSTSLPVEVFDDAGTKGIFEKFAYGR